MQITLVAFGISKDILGASSLTYELREPATVTGLLDQLNQDYPEFKRLASIRVAVNEEYASNELAISEHDEVVLIPPVSGG
ncbi:MAG: MoaD/ThiS family protein [Bacteroidota bacterium]